MESCECQQFTSPMDPASCPAGFSCVNFVNESWIPRSNQKGKSAIRQIHVNGEENYLSNTLFK